MTITTRATAKSPPEDELKKAENTKKTKATTPEDRKSKPPSEAKDEANAGKLGAKHATKSGDKSEESEKIVAAAEDKAFAAQEQKDPDKRILKQDDPSKDDSQKSQDAPTKQDHTNAESAAINYEDGGGSGGMSLIDAEIEGQKIPDRTLDGKTEDEKKPSARAKAKGKDTDGDDEKQRQLGASEEQIAAKKAYDDAEKDYAEHPQISRTYDGEEDVAAINKRRNAERAYKLAGKEIPEHTGYVFLDSRPKQTNIGAGAEESQGKMQTKETIRKEDANVENR